MLKNRTNIILTVSFLLIVNFSAHFLPFERASLGNDDYALSVKAIGLSSPEILSLSIRQPDRPLAFVLLMNQERYLYDHPQTGILFILFFTSAVLIAVFFLLKAVFKDLFLALLGALIFCLIPNKLEIYHIPVYTPNSAAHLFYIISFISMMDYAGRKKNFSFAVSVISYSVGLFFYEMGFFLPFVYIGLFYLTKDRALKKSFYFLIPAVFYFLFKATGVFGFADPTAIHFHKPTLAMLPANIIDLSHHYIGRYMARNIVYGFYNFLAIKPLCPLIVLDSALLAAVFIIIKKNKARIVDGQILVIAALSFVFFCAPILINSFGGVGGRHLELASIGVALFIVWLVERTGKLRLVFYMLLIAAALVVCQGNSWTQVVACRINGAVYEVIKEKKKELTKADNIIIDTKSFADRIPYTWVKQDFNVLNTYYGAQAFEDWGLASMVRLATGCADKAVYVAAAESPKLSRNDTLEFSVLRHNAYRSVSREAEIVPSHKVFIIDFNSVYGDDFNDGIRSKR